MPMQARGETNTAEWLKSEGGQLSVLTGRAFGSIFTKVLTAPFSTTVSWDTTNSWSSSTGCKAFFVTPIPGQITTASMMQLFVGWSTTESDQADIDTQLDGLIGTYTTVTGTEYTNVDALHWETITPDTSYFGKWDGVSKIKTICVKVNTTVAADKKCKLTVVT